MRGLDDGVRARLSAVLEEVGEVDAHRRRIDPADLVELIRVRSGLVTLHGGTEAVDAEHTPYPVPTAGSASQVVDAVLVDQREPGAVSWRTQAVPTELGEGPVAFLFSLAMGNGSGSPQPTGTFVLELEGREVARLALVKGRHRWRTEAGLLAFVPGVVRSVPFGPVFAVDDVLPLESTYVDGHAVLVVDPGHVTPGRPNVLTMRALAEEPSRQWARIGLTPWFGVFVVESHLDALRYAVAAPEVVEHGGHRLLLGDLHTHSGESSFLDSLGPDEDAEVEEACGVGSRASMFRFARDVAGLDFFCLSEHDWQMDAHDWSHLRGLNDEFLADDFTTIHGFEWTSMSYGHRNVYFADEPGSLFFAQDPLNPYDWHAPRPSPADLWAHLHDEGHPALTIPHHMSAAQFPLDLRDFNDPDFDRVAEIYSAWGDSLEHGEPVTQGATRIERLELVRAIRDGYRIGFIASSDSHDAHPGLANGSERRAQLFHHLGSGRAGVYAAGASRASIFDALAARRTFAATGDGLSVWTTLDERPMGSEQERSPGPADFALSVHSELPLSSATVYRNGRRSERVDLLGERHLETSWPEVVGGDATRSIFVKIVRSDGETAWSSPHWID